MNRYKIIIIICILFLIGFGIDYWFFPTIEELGEKTCIEREYIKDGLTCNDIVKSDMPEKFSENLVCYQPEPQYEAWCGCVVYDKIEKIPAKNTKYVKIPAKTEYGKKIDEFSFYLNDEAIKKECK